ncbi:hypothetical protein J5X98_06190 [Leptothermofonsia sichuanensis E412]|uniref:hypothetical protein n=1 Tax=Leptothermofonsia sichuanensis TaxID=2917832 RepID=UPI001CA6CA95|nr:hypothetical protein [Leptothermofonsia sichuanensis]QZZ23825.1 hypothetical protein J5X98_06190 [Leptothermofonsia sichuanensis E412]
MTQRLKRWESPRREGRNDKGKGGSARQRQKRKQFQALRKRLKDQSSHQNHQRGGIVASPPFLRFNFKAESHDCYPTNLFPGSFNGRFVFQVVQ